MYFEGYKINSFYLSSRLCCNKDRKVGISIHFHYPEGVIIMEIKTILIPVDGSEPAENAFRYGVGLAEENGATIVLLHVLDANETYYATNRVMLAGGMLDERKETAQRVMDQMKSQVPEGITCKTVIAAGVPGETACRTAKEENADLIVVGNSGKGAISSFVMGSVSRYIIHHVHCPVLVVK